MSFFYKHFFLLSFFASVFNVFSQNILPAPEVYKNVEGFITISEEFSVIDENLPDGLKDYLTEYITSKLQRKVVYSIAGRHLVFKKLYNVPKDHYSINANEKVTISYSSEASCFYALQSLFQLIDAQDNLLSIKKCFIADQPKFEWRGLHLDVSRHFFTVEEVKKYIDLMSRYKFNVFHWHLTDDQGWRIEIKKYPKLTEIGAWRDSTVNAHYTTSPRTYDKTKYGGFYTQDEIKEVVDYASKRFINVVPEIEMPGHARAALAAYPQYSCTGIQQGVEGLWGVFDDIFCANKETISFLQDVLDEVLTLFPSQYIHIGGDEAPKTRWKKCAKCQQTIQNNHLKDEHELQSWFIKQMDAYLTAKGRKLIGWDEILEGGLSPNATVMSWRGFEGGVEASKLGHDVVMSPGSHCYFDHYQSKNSFEPLAIGGYTPIEKVYDFSPVSEEMTIEQSAHVLGGQANVWTEYIPDFKQVEYMVYPRAIALAQALWCKNKEPFEQFKSKLIDSHLPWLKKNGVNYSEAIFYPEIEIVQNGTGFLVKFKSVDSNNMTVTLNNVEISKSYQVNRTNDDIKENYFIATSKVPARTNEFHIWQHPSIGLEVEFITKPAPQYNSGGNLLLVDGVTGEIPWKGNEWKGFQEKEISFVVDLNETKKLANAEINFLQDESSWIHKPEKVKILISKDKNKWKKLTKAVIYPQNMEPQGKYFQFQIPLTKKARYVKFEVTAMSKIPEGMPGAGHQPWTFIDELMIIAK